MKKVIVSAAICVFGLDTANGMLVPYNRDNGAIVRRDVEVSNVDQSEMDAVACVNFRKIQPTPLPLQNKVSVLISEYCCADGKSVQVSDSFVRHYPLRREMLGYWHNFEAGKSYPMQKLFVHIDDIEFANQSGDIVLDDEYIDGENGIIHQKRTVNRYEMDDANLQAKPLTEIFISTESGDQVIDEAKVRKDDEALSYLKLNENSWLRPDGSILNPVLLLTYSTDLAYQIKCYGNTYNHSTYEPYGSPFVKRTEDWKRIAKPKLPAPITRSPMQIIFDLRNILHLEYRLNRNLPDNVNPYKKREELIKQ